MGECSDTLTVRNKLQEDTHSRMLHTTYFLRSLMKTTLTVASGQTETQMKVWEEATQLAARLPWGGDRMDPDTASGELAFSVVFIYDKRMHF